MELQHLLRALNAGETIMGDSPLHAVMHRVSQDALRITSELNGGYQEPARVRELLAQLTGKPVDDSVTVFPPFYSDFGKNITLGRRIFINSGCTFQDQGGVVIGDECLIGPGVTIGDDAVVAAASVVTKDVPPKSIVVGSPARVMRSLSN